MHLAGVCRTNVVFRKHASVSRSTASSVSLPGHASSIYGTIDRKSPWRKPRLVAAFAAVGEYGYQSIRRGPSKEIQALHLTKLRLQCRSP